jgi:thiol-disulfide isomerase/thioredoxin
MSVRIAPEARGSSSTVAVTRRAAALQVLTCAVALLYGSAAAEAPRRLEPFPHSPPPPFTLANLDGATVVLGDLRGSPVLVHFFATWCEPCKAEFATLAQLAARRPQIKILAINVGEPAVRVRAFAAAEKIALPILLDADRKVTKAWHVSVLPTTVVLDEAHTARLHVEGDLDWSRDDTVSAIDALTNRKP